MEGGPAELSSPVHGRGGPFQLLVQPASFVIPTCGSSLPSRPASPCGLLPCVCLCPAASLTRTCHRTWVRPLPALHLQRLFPSKVTAGDTVQPTPLPSPLPKDNPPPAARLGGGLQLWGQNSWRPNGAATGWELLSPEPHCSHPSRGGRSSWTRHLETTWRGPGGT